MHSYIICYAEKRERYERLKRMVADFRKEKKLLSFDPLESKDPDIFVLHPEPTIKIRNIRELQSRLKLKPFAANCKIAVIGQANLLTLQAQHALLKTLEEPTPDTYLLLELENPYHLLETIRSRCQIIRAQKSPLTRRGDKAEAKTIPFENLDRLSPGERVQLAQELSQEKAPTQTLRKTLNQLRKLMRKDPGWGPSAKVTQRALHDLQSNVNESLALEHLLLNFPKVDKE